MTTKVLNDKKHVLVYPIIYNTNHITYQYVCFVEGRYMLTEDISLAVILHCSDDITHLKEIITDSGNHEFVKIPTYKLKYIDIHEVTSTYSGPLIDKF